MGRALPSVVRVGPDHTGHPRRWGHGAAGTTKKQNPVSDPKVLETQKLPTKIQNNSSNNALINNLVKSENNTRTK